MRIEGRFEFLGVFDALSILIWIIIFFSLVSTTYSKNQLLTHYRYYRTGFYVKFFSAIVFSIIYILKYSGGDSTAYWDSAQKLNNLFWSSPLKYFNEIFTLDPMRMRYNSFDLEVGLPPNWIYKEDEAWFAAKVFSLLTFITFKSYFAMTMITAYISFRVSWLLYEVVLKYKIIGERSGAIATLFLPSTCFWCTGITKDMIIYSAVIYLLIQLFTFLNKENLYSYRNVLFALLTIYLIISIRDFMLIAAVGPFFMALGARWSKRLESDFSKFFIQFLFIGVVLFGVILFLGSEKGQEFAKEAEVIQTDLNTNSTYSDNRYDLGITDFSPAGMFRAMPISIFTAFYRPFLWEPGSLFIKISALESFVFLILTIRLLFSGVLISSLREIRNNELLMASLVFTLILGFFAGYTSGLFGVLVRFKAPLLPFLFLVLIYKKQEEIVQIDTKV
jgi:hypothetical protein